MTFFYQKIAKYVFFKDFYGLIWKIIAIQMSRYFL